MSKRSFTKLFRSILDSTLWVLHDKHVKVVWITMLADADGEGFVASSIPGLAKRAGVSIEECEDALRIFLSPDKYSRTPDHEGRRIKEVMGGWILLNYEKRWKELNAESEKERKREYAREYRARMKEDVPPSDLRSATNSEVAQVASLSISLSSSGSDPDPDRARSKPGAIFAPEDLEMNAAQLVRCQELRFDPVEVLRAFKLQEFNRAYTDWPRRLSKWIEEQKVRRETENAKKLGAKRNGGESALALQAERIRMLEEQERQGLS